jgi:hypothetical protein
MRDHVSIPARYGAEVFTNQGGGITIEQHQEDDEELRVLLTFEEALLVAAALREVAECVRGAKGEGGVNDDSQA